MEHVPSGAFGSLYRGGSSSWAETLLILAVVAAIFYGGVWVLLKLSDLLQRIRDNRRRPRR